MGERKFVQMVLVTWPRMPPCPFMVKSLKNFLLRNQKADDLETWYAVSGARVLPNFVQMMTLGWPWPILRQGQIWSLMVLYGKRKKGFFRNYCRLWFETSNKWPKWQEVSVDIKTLSPGGCLPPAPGLFTCSKSWKNCIKSDFKEISLKLATNG